jgi:hypothetical protein
MPKYYLRGSVRGSFTMIVDADSADDARREFEAMAEDETFEPGIDEIEDITLNWVKDLESMTRKSPQHSETPDE